MSVHHKSSSLVIMTILMTMINAYLLSQGTIEKCKYDIEIEFPDGAVAIAPSSIAALVLDMHNMQVSQVS